MAVMIRIFVLVSSSHKNGLKIEDIDYSRGLSECGQQYAHKFAHISTPTVISQSNSKHSQSRPYSGPNPRLSNVPPFV
jgi:hypothetical protein